MIVLVLANDFIGFIQSIFLSLKIDVREISKQINWITMVNVNFLIKLL